MKKYNEILKLKKMLEDEGIEFIFKPDFNGYHIFDKNGISILKGWSVIEHDFSYGREKDLLEIAGEIMTEKERKREQDDVLVRECDEEWHAPLRSML